MVATVSVIIPAYNAGPFLGAAIESVLAQGVEGLELIVVDDGSEDCTARVARRFGTPVRVIEQENRGIGLARNAGIAASAGELLAFLDADDAWTEGALAARLQVLSNHLELDGVFGLVENWQDGEAAAALDVKAGTTAPGQIAGTMLIRRTSFEKAGPFTDLRLGEFIEWYARAIDAGLRFNTLQQVLLRRRIHAASTTATTRDRSAYLRAMQSIIARRRAEGR